MASFIPTSRDLRVSLLFCFKLQKTAAESHRMLVEAYGEQALSKTQCFDWFKKFKRGDFSLCNEERGRPSKKFADADLLALLDVDGGHQTQRELGEKLCVSREAISRRLSAMEKARGKGKRRGLKGKADSKGSNQTA